MNSVKKLLSQHKKEILPDNKIKNNIKQKICIEQKQTSLVYAHNGQQKSNNVLNYKMIFCAIALIFVFFVGIFIPVLLNKDFDNDKNKICNKFAQVVNAETFFAYSAASVSNLLSSSYVQTNFSHTSHLMSVKMQSTQTDLYSTQTETIDKYMSLVENLLSKSEIESNITNGELNYQFVMNIHYTNLSGKNITYKMLFNKILLEEEIEDDAVEQNYAIDGILFKGNEEYNVEGLYKVETENGESESEMFFKAFLNSEKTSYIEVQQNFESENENGNNEIDQEFVYSLYNKGNLVEQNTIQYESENNELSLSMQIIIGEKINNLLFDCDSKNGESVVYVTGNINDEVINYYISIQKDGYKYILGDKND